jgi:hypothetical protein
MKTEVEAACLIQIVRTKKRQKGAEMLIQFIRKSLLSVDLACSNLATLRSKYENVFGAPPTAE